MKVYFTVEADMQKQYLLYEITEDKGGVGSKRLIGKFYKKGEAQFHADIRNGKQIKGEDIRF